MKNLVASAVVLRNVGYAGVGFSTLVWLGFVACDVLSLIDYADPAIHLVARTLNIVAGLASGFILLWVVMDIVFGERKASADVSSQNR